MHPSMQEVIYANLINLMKRYFKTLIFDRLKLNPMHLTLVFKEITRDLLNDLP